jgi:putative FmdB family regulatory protein
MPTYDYRCNACGHEFETMHGMTAPVLRKCPKCGKLKLERLISGGAGVIFKGSGFYETDYKRNRRGADSSKDSKEASESKAEKAKSEKPAEPTKTETKSDATSGTTPAPKPDAKPKKDSGSKKD